MIPTDPDQVGWDYHQDGSSWWWVGTDGHSYHADRFIGATSVEIRHSFFCRGCTSLHDCPDTVTIPYQAFRDLVDF